MRYLIDGYNLIFTDRHAPNELEGGRKWLLDRLVSFSTRREVVVVFDAPAQEGHAARHHLGPLEVVFTARGETADAYITSLLEHRPKSLQTTVVTSDRHLRKVAVEWGAQVLTPVEFWSRLEVKVSDEGAKPQTISEADRARWLAIFSERLKEQDT